MYGLQNSELKRNLDFFHVQIPYILEITASCKLAAQAKCWVLIQACF